MIIWFISRFWNILVISSPSSNILDANCTISLIVQKSPFAYIVSKCSTEKYIRSMLLLVNFSCASGMVSCSSDNIDCGRMSLQTLLITRAIFVGCEPVFNLNINFCFAVLSSINQFLSTIIFADFEFVPIFLVFDVCTFKAERCSWIHCTSRRYITYKTST